MNPAYTHQPVLFACAASLGYKDLCIELGAGWGSTFQLDAIANSVTGATFMSFENSPAWMKELRTADASPHFPVQLVTDYDEVPLQRVDLLFIDNGPVERRQVDLARWAEFAELIIIHDTECKDYNLDTLLGNFLYRFDDKRWPAWTTVVSNKSFAMINELEGAIRATHS